MLARTLTCVGLVCAFAGTAHADADSILTVGVGTGVGYLHAAQPGETGETTFVNQGNIRLKMFSILGLDYSLDLGKGVQSAGDGELQYGAKMRLTAIAYVVPTSKVSFYLGGGVGGANAGELFQLTGAGNSYHVGAGLEVYLSGHVSVDTSFYMVIPGVDSVSNHVEQQLALSAAAAGTSGATASPEPSVGDYVSPKNYELMIRVFLFL
ncbi:MAG: hypothetical protein CVU56_23155 [Deltaproteobacteria bacterium HGW-Deltaproteobacteria-14]|jgi:opacity protein-like surface antigen|nr:MAG: hypothetical protein CVU56_23155 [Deltaproteobacteria bacterium HGW-Deltaproteobacteria-14]